MGRPAAALQKQDSPVEFIEPPNLVKQKVGSGGFDPIAMRHAEIAVEELGVDYELRLRQEVAALDAAFAEMRREGAFDPPKLFAIAHTLRGEAGTYGYPLVSAIGNTLARFLEDRRGLDAAGCEIVESHVNALRAVAARNVKGDGGEIGAQLVAGLAAMVTRALG